MVSYKSETKSPKIQRNFSVAIGVDSADFIISEEDKGKRLDRFLTENFREYSRSFLQKLIKTEGALVNNKKVSPHYFLRIDDKIEIKEKDLKRLKKAKEIDLKPTMGMKLNVVYEDSNFLIINKPSGLVVHPSVSYPNDTLVNILLAHHPSIKGVGESKLRPGIVHRLDKNASGLLVIAKTRKAFDHLKRQFQTRKVFKEYTILTWGEVKEDRGIIDLSIGRSKRVPTKMVVKREKEGRRAETHFKVIKYFKNFTLLKAQTKTGRTHQVRVHFNAIGHPIVGDKRYGKINRRSLWAYRPKGPGAKIKNNLDRLFLHASRLGFYDLDEKWREFKIALPEKLKGYLDKLK